MQTLLIPLNAGISCLCVSVTVSNSFPHPWLAFGLAVTVSRTIKCTSAICFTAAIPLSLLTVSRFGLTYRAGDFNGFLNEAVQLNAQETAHKGPHPVNKDVFPGGGAFTTKVLGGGHCWVEEHPCETQPC